MQDMRRAKVDVLVVDPRALASPAMVFREFNFETMLDKDIFFEAPFEVVVTQKVVQVGHLDLIL
jgi:hypothetical protein